MLRTFLFAATAIATLATAGHAGEMRFSEAASQPQTRAALVELLGEQPKWVPFVLDNGGVENPAETLTISGQTFKYYETCKAHECYAKKIGMAISPDGAVFVRIFGEEAEDKIYGNPPAELAEVMQSQ